MGELNALVTDEISPVLSIRRLKIQQFQDLLKKMLLCYWFAVKRGLEEKKILQAKLDVHKLSMKLFIKMYRFFQCECACVCVTSCADKGPLLQSMCGSRSARERERALRSRRASAERHGDAAESIKATSSGGK